MSTSDREATMGLCVVIMEAQFDEQCVLTDVCRKTLQLQCLEAGPSEKVRVGGRKFSKAFGKVLIGIAHGGLVHAGKLARSVLADRLM